MWTRRASAVVLGFIALALAAGPAHAATKAPKPVVLTTEQINAALITIDDLPTGAGYQALKGLNGDPVTPTPSGPDPTGGVCNRPDMYSLAQKAHNVALGLTAFYNTNSDGPYVGETVF